MRDGLAINIMGMPMSQAQHGQQASLGTANASLAWGLLIESPQVDELGGAAAESEDQQGVTENCSEDGDTEQENTAHVCRSDQATGVAATGTQLTPADREPDKEDGLARGTAPA
ncbi:hypothetical protein HaLaN_10212, partial [Haematococcus lacustris]